MSDYIDNNGLFNSECIDPDLLIAKITRTDSDHDEVIEFLLHIREYMKRYELAKQAYIELTNNRDHANNCYFADNELMDKFDKAFTVEE